jgi:hypothetical protein
VAELHQQMLDSNALIDRWPNKTQLTARVEVNRKRVQTLAVLVLGFKLL